MNNSGKNFEIRFKKSVPDYCLLYRLNDPPQIQHKSNSFRFSWKNPFDYFLFDTYSRRLFCLELKTTKSNSISFEKLDDDKSTTRMIHKHQIKSLIDFGKYPNVVAGFIFNFRKGNVEFTFFQSINDFMDMYEKINKLSFNINDLEQYNAVEILGTKSRTQYIWDISKFLEDLKG